MEVGDASVQNFLVHSHHVEKESAYEGIRGNSKGRDVENGGNTFFNSCADAVES
jgi:hypothetical protein